MSQNGSNHFETNLYRLQMWTKKGGSWLSGANSEPVMVDSFGTGEATRRSFQNVKTEPIRDISKHEEVTHRDISSGNELHY